MTIATTTNRVDAPGNGSATAFSFAPVVIFDPSNLQVTVRDSSGIETLLTQGAGSANYSVSVTAYPGTGSITYPASGGSPLPVGSTIVIKRIVPLTQSVSLVNQGAYFPAIQEGEFDYLTAIDQQQQEQIGRTIQLAATDAAIPVTFPTSAQRAGQFLSFDSNGVPTAALPSGVGVPISVAMQPIVAAATFINVANAFFTGAVASLVTELLSFLQAGTGAITRAVIFKLRDYMTVADFGAIGDGTTDDTANLQKAIDCALLNCKTLHLVGTVGTNFKITSALVVSGPIRIVGSNPSVNRLIASGNFVALMTFTAAAAGVQIDSVGFNTDGTTTSCLTFAQGAQVITFNDCAFSGSLTGQLIYSQAAGYVEYVHCNWNCNGSGTVGIELDGFNQNTVFLGGHAGGPGRWLLIANSTGNIANNVQGTKATGFTSICTGSVAIQLSGSPFSTQFIGCIIDQAATNCIVIGTGSMLTQIIGGYYGLAGASGVPILLTADCGVGTQINGAQTYGGSNAISVQASGASRVGGVSITNNLFLAASTVTVSLDSVNGCILENNVDISTPTNGSWATVATYGAGAYTEGGNSWHTSSPANIHGGSSYHCRPSRGITMANKGGATSASGTTLVVPHGLVITPNNIKITQLGGGGMAALVTSADSTNFTISYGTAGAATFMWEAEYYT